MEVRGAKINQFLVEVFDQILRRAEDCLTARYPRLSLREIHLIDAVCRAVDHGGDNRATAIAAAQGVTAGTLTTVVNQLEKKGYLRRARDDSDKRSVRLLPTERGREAVRRHAAFHREMVAEILRLLTPEEAAVLLRSLRGIAAFFHDRYLRP